MKAKTRNVLIGTAIAAAVGATGLAVADMGGYGADCPQGAQMQQGQGYGGHGQMHGQMQGRGMHGYGAGAMMGQMMGGMQGQGAGAMMGGMQGGMMDGMGYGLNLSDEQRTEMGKIRQQFLPRMGELRGKMQANHEQLQAQRQGGAADQAAIDELADQKGALMAEMIKLRAAHQARMQALLTDEQRERMREHRPGMGMGTGMMGTPPAEG
ncbi:MAG TPA: Spy/CpxP family protein refolding chaperone [Gammaproteobacteria bacterium]|nr:Spy/CpxP family protein refolding chaperone [Gammaproteobacteria bacterium]